jgi:mono/diheme cytochrome c family protein
VLKIAIGALWLTAYLATQDPAPKPASGGVYTEAQAARGKDIFGSLCSSCHNITSQSGATFAKRWNGVAVSDLFMVLTETMPKDDAGSLTPQERVDTIAYLLKINGIAAGTADLPADPELLKKIVIDLVVK